MGDTSFGDTSTLGLQSAPAAGLGCRGSPAPLPASLALLPAHRATFPGVGSRADADSPSRLAALPFPRELPRGWGDAGNTPGKGCQPSGAQPSPPAGLARSRQPKPAVSDPPLVAIKHSQVHEPAAPSAGQALGVGNPGWGQLAPARTGQGSGAAGARGCPAQLRLLIHQHRGC